MPWPNDLSPDLRRRLEAVLSFRSVGAADIWGEVRDWLEKIGAEPPAEGVEAQEKPEDFRY